MTKRNLRIWSLKGKLDYYNFKSKKELVTSNVGDLAVVNHKLVRWNHYTNTWD